MRPLISFLALLLGCASAENARAEVAQIQITHTWGELIDTTPIHFKEIPDGAKSADIPAAGETPSYHVWVGVDRDHVGSNGGVLVYCLAEGIAFYERYEDGLGPFQVRIEKIGTDAADRARELEQELAPAAAKYELYTRVVPVQDPGEYVIELQESPKPNGMGAPHVFARMKVEVSNDISLAWSPWGASMEEGQRMSTASGINSEFVCNPLGGIALPKSPRGGISLTDLPARDQPLPQLNLENPDPGVQLKMVENTLIVTLKEGLDDDYPSDDFLTRWWVNDKPFVPDPSKMEAQQARDQAERMVVGGIKEDDFKLDFRPERLGVKAGDKVGVQLLVCPYGWEYAEPQHIARAQDELIRSLPPTDICYPTPRIDFIYSGNPQALQQK